jgi:hypothetical protein
MSEQGPSPAKKWAGFSASIPDDMARGGASAAVREYQPPERLTTSNVVLTEFLDDGRHLSDVAGVRPEAARRSARCALYGPSWGCGWGDRGEKVGLREKEKTPKNIVFIRVSTVVPRAGIEPATPGFSDLCSTN